MIYPVFDLDGVLRDMDKMVTGITGIPVTDYHGNYNGKSIVGVIMDNMQILSDAPKTEYCDLVMKYVKNPIILTNQPPSWQAKTIIWMDKHLPGNYYEFADSMGKIAILKGLNTYAPHILIEDHPEIDYAGNTFTYLVVRAYNQNANCPEERRIRTVEDMERLLKNCLGMP